MRTPKRTNFKSWDPEPCLDFHSYIYQISYLLVNIKYNFQAVCLLKEAQLTPPPNPPPFWANWLFYARKIISFQSEFSYMMYDSPDLYEEEKKQLFIV